MADDMGYGDLGCYNSDSKIPTPNMDRLAESGMRFTDAHSSSAVCTPSRYSVLTGRYCWRTTRRWGVNGGLSLPLIDTARETFASMLKKQGYKTGAVGKWHVGLQWQVKGGRVSEFNPECWSEDESIIDYSKPILDGPLQHGFDSFFGIAGSLDMPPYAFIENDRTVGIPDIPKREYLAQQKVGFQTSDWDDETVDMVLTDKACEFIESASEEPFFLYFTPAAPHRPCQPPEFARGKSRAGSRGDMVWLVDWSLGRVMEALERKSLADNTLIVLTSDNGARPCDVDMKMWDHKSCGDLRGYKAEVWEGGHRVPFIMSCPGRIESGVVCDELVGIFDTMATIADITGYELEGNDCEDSYSFLPVIEGGKSLRHEMVHHSFYGMYGYRKDGWKFIDGLGGGGDMPIAPAEDGPCTQVYDMVNDHCETTDLSEQRPGIAQALKDELEKIKVARRVV